MKKIKVQRFLQDPHYCVVSAIATVANYYNKEINYIITKDIATKSIKNSDQGLDTGEIGKLLNLIGFNKVTLVSGNPFIFDYSWTRVKRKKLVENLKLSKNRIHSDYRVTSNSIYKWLKNYNFDNKIIIDYEFGKYIRNFISKNNKPVIITFNWTMLFRFPKDKNGIKDPIKGESEEHAVVIQGYNKKGVYVCDSHHQYYKYKRKEYRKGFYKISWEKLMTVMMLGDLFLPEDYDKNLVKF